MGNNSFERINYSLRPAKAVERKMISFSLQKLNSFSNLSDYQYIGFGSTFFQDHILFHKELGISKLVSIEKSGKKERFNFNKPFHCINIKFGQSADILPNIDWSDKSILWLDYDKIIQSSYLSDVRTFFSSAISKSVFMLTINVQDDHYGKTNKEREKTLIDRIGEKKIPLPNKPINYSNNNLHSTLKTILDNEIKNTLSIRNGVIGNEEDKFIYKPIFNFQYADGAKMLTVGGILLKKSEVKLYNQANFEELTFVKTGNDIFKIEIPSLTLKEIRFLNSQLPSGIGDEGEYLNEEVASSDPLIPKKDILKYRKIYRYFPVFVESLAI